MKYQRKAVLKMLKKQEELVLSPYAKLYDILIEKDHELRKINELVDFQFIYDALEDTYCSVDGRNAINPVRMFKYLLLKVIYHLSDRDLVKRTKTDLAFKFFLDMAPEEDVIAPTSLTKFRRLRLKDMNLLDTLIEKTVEIAIDKNVLKSKTIIVDATHTISKFNQKSPVDMLRTYSKVLRKEVYSIDEKLKTKFPNKTSHSDLELEKEYSAQLITTVEKLPIAKLPNIQSAINTLKEKIDDIDFASTESFDPDARVGHKTAESSFI